MLITRRYLVDKVVSAPYVEKHAALEQNFIREVSKLVPGANGVTIDNYTVKNMRLINEYNGNVQDMYREFIVKSGIAPALNGSEVEKPTFDNFFTWDIVCSIHSKRLFIEARSATEELFPIKREYSFLKELDEARFLVLSGRREM